MTRTTAVVLAMACSGCFLDPDSDGPVFAFDAQTIDLSLARDTAFVLSNNGADAYGPIELVITALETTAGMPAAGPQVTVTPTTIATLNPGERKTVIASIETSESTPDNAYRAVIEARIGDFGTVASLELLFTIVACQNADVATVTFNGAPSSVRQGDVTTFPIVTLDQSGNDVMSPPPCWTIVPPSAGFIDNNGAFVGYQPGDVTIAVQLGSAADSMNVSVTPRETATGTLTTVGTGEIHARYTSDLWIHGTTAYTGTWGSRSTPDGTVDGNTLYVWDVTNPTTPNLTDSIRIDARVVNDVKVRAAGDLAVITHEGSGDGQNGITLLNLSDPLHPTVLTRFTSSLTPGVHNVWIDDNFVYVAVDGSDPSSGLRVLDIRNVSQPQIVAEFYGGSSFLHDVYVRDGLAFLSHWNAGLIILDVGNGIVGGAPDNPVEVSRILTEGGQTHNAWYWPENGYVFVGEEDFGTPGIMHVVDVRDLQRPEEVATFRVPEIPPHNFWVDETAEILYAAWYDKGIHMVDVSGRLLGELDRQNRELASAEYNGNLTRTWAPQLHDGLLFVSDLESGLFVLRFMSN